MVTIMVTIMVAVGVWSPANTVNARLEPGAHRDHPTHRTRPPTDSPEAGPGEKSCSPRFPAPQELILTQAPNGAWHISAHGETMGDTDPAVVAGPQPVRPQGRTGGGGRSDFHPVVSPRSSMHRAVGAMDGQPIIQCESQPRKQNGTRPTTHVPRRIRLRRIRTRVDTDSTVEPGPQPVRSQGRTGTGGRRGCEALSLRTFL